MWYTRLTFIFFSQTEKFCAFLLMLLVSKKKDGSVFFWCTCFHQVDNWGATGNYLAADCKNICH